MGWSSGLQQAWDCQAGASISALGTLTERREGVRRCGEGSDEASGCDCSSGPSDSSGLQPSTSE